ncbi:hypothetical protein [Aquimarina longa]|nr:hypothetical protein [Aquimarina longa]
MEFFNHPEGYVEKEADGYKYVYQFKDHLGNGLAREIQTIFLRPMLHF